MKDITGKRFGKLIAIKPLKKGKRGFIWLCKCECGNYKEVSIVSLTQGWRTSCGCLLGGPKGQNLKGKRFGRLFVVESLGRRNLIKNKSRKTEPIWSCLCDCGKTTIKSTHALLHGTKSCGCLQREAGSKNGKKKIKPETFLRRFFRRYRDSAKRRDLIFDLSLSEFEGLVKAPCYLCGAEPQPKALCRAKYYHKEILFNGIDRINNKLGYTLENTRPCCTRCNKMKLDLSYSEFIEHLKKVLVYQGL